MNDVFMKDILEIAVCLLAVMTPGIRFVVRKEPFISFLNEEVEFAHIAMRDVDGLRITRGDLRFGWVELP